MTNTLRLFCSENNTLEAWAHINGTDITIPSKINVDKCRSPALYRTIPYLRKRNVFLHKVYEKIKKYYF